MNLRLHQPHGRTIFPWFQYASTCRVRTLVARLGPRLGTCPRGSFPAAKRPWRFQSAQVRPGTRRRKRICGPIRLPGARSPDSFSAAGNLLAKPFSPAFGRSQEPERNCLRRHAWVENGKLGIVFCKSRIHRGNLTGKNGPVPEGEESNRRGYLHPRCLRMLRTGIN